VNETDARARIATDFPDAVFAQCPHLKLLSLWGTGTDNLRLAPGMYDIVYDLRSLPLRPGPYRWQVSIFDSGRFIDGGDCIPNLDIKTAPVGHRNDDYAGFLNLPYSIDIRPQPPRQGDLDLEDAAKGYAAHSA